MEYADYNYSEEMEELVSEEISDMWTRLSDIAFAEGTSLGAIASKAGISVSNIYESVRRSSNSSHYADNLIINIKKLADELGIDLDEALLGLPREYFQSNYATEDMNKILRSMSPGQQDQLRIEMIAALEN